MTSPPASPPDDVLREILLRLPPQPSHLLRTASVCTGWRRLVADPHFLRQYRARHGERPPIAGVFHNNPRVRGRFIAAGDRPADRLPAERFSPRDLGCARWLVLGRARWLVHGCHRGRAVLHAGDGRLLVWDPVTGDRRHVTLPPLNHGYCSLNAVLFGHGGGGDDGGGDGDGGGGFSFRIAIASVAAGAAVAAVYSSETGAWGSLAMADAWTSVPSEKPGAAVGEAVYWLLNDGGVLSLKLWAGGLQALAVLAAKVPSAYAGNVQLTRTPDGELGLAAVLGSELHLRALETDGGGAMSWTLRRTVRLDAALVHGGPGDIAGGEHEQRPCVRIVGVHDGGAVVFLWTATGVFMVRLSESTTEVKKMHGIDETHGQFYAVHPYASFFSQRSHGDGGYLNVV
ncbi:hypothetical protein ACP4OV_003415 [Aristida adscensionis]